MRNKNIFLSQIILVIFVVLYFIKSGYLIGTILFTVIFFELAFTLVALFNRKKINISLECRGENIILFCKNSSFLPQTNLVIELLYENITTQENDIKKIKVSMLPRENRELAFKIDDREQGGIEVSIVSMVYKSFLGGLFPKQSISQEKCLVNKGIELDEGYIKDFGAELYDMESYKFSQTQKGSDASDTFGISAYDTSKSVKNIHWKLSSKSNQLLVRDLGFPIDSNVSIIFDKHIGEKLQDNLKVTDEEKIKTRKNRSLESTRLAFSISYALIHSNIKHKFIWFDFDISSLECYRVNTIEDYNKMVSKVIFTRWNKAVPKLEKQLAINQIADRGSQLFIVTQNEDSLNLDNIKVYGEVNIYTPKK